MTDATYSGRCLCGEVRYTVQGAPWRFLHCHCERCRRATGTGHATNLLVKSDGVDWHGTEGNITRYKLPAAERFGTTFCKTCGGHLPREGTGIVVIPAGSLDSEIEGLPEGRIFWESRAEWSCEAGSLPAYAEYPTG